MIAAIKSIENLSDRVRVFQLELPEAVMFAAGQFVIVKAQIGGENVERSYSIANECAGETQHIELCIALNPSGKMSPHLFGLSPGAALEMSLPQGGFVLRDAAIEVPTIFVCTGTGVAPFRSMIASKLKETRESMVYLVMGNRASTDMLYHQHWMDLQYQQPRFRYLPTLSRGDGQEKGVLTGYVHAHYSEIVKAHPEVQVYVCGWEVMCKEARQRLKDMGLTRRQYFFEQYDG
ncbi:MAG: ferredoxin--NADP reductase [Bacteroidota bacterium]